MGLEFADFRSLSSRITVPHVILGVSHDVGEADLRQRYLELVRQNSPEKRPREFAEIREAGPEVR